MYGCTATWVWVIGSDDAKIVVDNNLDSIDAKGTYTLFGPGGNNKPSDTVVVRERLIDTLK